MRFLYLNLYHQPNIQFFYMLKALSVIIFCILQFSVFAQNQPFRFAFISDTHIGSPNGSAEEDLRRTVHDINERNDIAFVVLTGDITELGTNKELALAKQILDSLDVPYYIIPGNHDTGWSESGGLAFSKTFGNDKFYFKYNGIHFIGCASGPYVRMSDGHIPRHHINWLEEKLKTIKSGEPVVFLNHYPLDKGLDNWYEVISFLKQKNTVLALCGHGHSNRQVQAEAIPAIMGRSNLRAKAAEGGYNLVDVVKDSFHFTERSPLSKTEKKWRSIAFQTQQYTNDHTYPRPDFTINHTYAQVKPRWVFSSDANIISTPVATEKLIVFGNQNGNVQALHKETGKKSWSFKTGGPIFSSAAVSGDKIILGSADGIVYCLNDKGKLQWKLKTNGPVLGTPLIENNMVYIGGSDSCFQALELLTGKPIWRFCGLQGPVTSQAVIKDSILLFGVWDTNLYALHKLTGKLLWKWNNGSSVINFSPAACIPVVHDNTVYIAAPDRYLSAIDIQTGKTIWRSNSATVRESIGISEDGKLVYGKTMQDTIVAFHTNNTQPSVAWKMNAGFGYEHVPSMLIEKESKVFFGTKNGVVYVINPNTQKIIWAHKIDNSMVNTVRVLNGRQLIAATMDGKVVFLEETITAENGKPAK
jgi:outer membrane protein assembly factor BamB/predicted MPP superfamily phosphohydrolase